MERAVQAAMDRKNLAPSNDVQFGPTAAIAHSRKTKNAERRSVTSDIATQWNAQKLEQVHNLKELAGVLKIKEVPSTWVQTVETAAREIEYMRVSFTLTANLNAVRLENDRLLDVLRMQKDADDHYKTCPDCNGFHFCSKPRRMHEAAQEARESAIASQKT